MEADAEAYRVSTVAEAEAIRLINEQLTDSPHYVSLVVAKKWNGVLPVTTLSDVIPMVNLGQVKSSVEMNNSEKIQ